MVFAMVAAVVAAVVFVQVVLIKGLVNNCVLQAKIEQLQIAGDWRSVEDSGREVKRVCLVRTYVPLVFFFWFG